MDLHYRHTQIGYVAIAFLVFSIFLASLSIPWDLSEMGWSDVPVISIVIFLAVTAFLLQFCWLTVQVDEEAIRMRFGPGLIGKRFLLKDIKDCRAITNQWCLSWGINWMPGGGGRYTVSGSKTVELTFADGRKAWIGTDEPETLQKAIQEALS